MIVYDKNWHKHFIAYISVQVITMDNWLINLRAQSHLFKIYSLQQQFMC